MITPHLDKNETEAPDSGMPDEPSLRRTANESGAPEPPPAYSAERFQQTRSEIDAAVPDEQPATSENTVYIGNIAFKASEQTLAELDRARKILLAAEVMAFASVFVGGSLLSAAALVAAIVGYRSVSGVADRCQGSGALKAVLKRPGYIAVFLAALSLVLNVISLLVLMPMYEEIVQSGDLTGMFGGSSAGNAAPSPSAPGAGLFG